VQRHNVVVLDKTMKEGSGHGETLRVPSDDDRVCFVEISALPL